MKILLASSSPRRKELLKCLGHDVIIIPPKIKELNGQQEFDPIVVAQMNAQIKARNVFNTYGLMARDFILAADTVVLCDHQVIGKPKDVDEAREILHLLSNRSHDVITSFCLKGESKEEVATKCSKVEFRDLSEQEILAYLDTGEWRDKAGGYGVQGKGAALIHQVIGSITNVIGLPIEEFYEHANKFIKQGK